ncbi:exported hypothetical protein [Mesorhizobium prunaredense]|uniref:Bacterial OB-fold domain-containing protein n=1 Tax=Mesorhizobium prunaredense TaxID=1631249 RepID=A0A1R3V7P0_9HYPH|nr:exported hypothetical protein [Mesorhizobium prunaredense]
MKHRLVCILTTGLFLAVPAYVHAAEKLTIPQIQGSTHISPHARSTVIIEGAVTHIFGNNFIVRDEAGDGNDATSDSIIVRRKATGLTVGDRVRVEGVVREFNENDEPRTTTDINDAVFERLSSGVPLPLWSLERLAGCRRPIFSSFRNTAPTRKTLAPVSTRAWKARTSRSTIRLSLVRLTTLASSGSSPTVAPALPE